MLTKNARRNREIRKTWEWQQGNRTIMNTETRPYEPMVCGSCGEKHTLLYRNARLIAEPGVTCQCTNCGKSVVILSPSSEGAFFDLYSYASFGTKLRLALQRWLMDIL